MSEDEADDLTGKMLIAMPGLSDPRFAGSLVYLCAHSDEGAMGLIVNKPTPEIRFSDLLEQLGIESGAGPKRDIRIHFGGPVEHARGFVLHSNDFRSDGSTLEVGGDIGLTATIDVLEEMAGGDGPRRSILALGYSGWGPGQLESELAENSWLVCPAQDDLVFGRANDLKWMQALKSIGIDPLLLSSEGGRA